MIRTQEQSLSGEIRQYLLNREGEIDGLLLSDGTQVHFPPHLGTEVATIAQPGTSVVVQGQRERGNVVAAYAITNQSTGQTVVDDGPPAPAHPPLHRPHQGGLGPARHQAPPPPPHLLLQESR